MWSKWQQQIAASGEAARERLANTLEHAGDILTERASAHVASTKKDKNSESMSKPFLELEKNASGSVSGAPLELKDEQMKTDNKTTDGKDQDVQKDTTSTTTTTTTTTTNTTTTTERKENKASTEKKLSTEKKINNPIAAAVAPELNIWNNIMSVADKQKQNLQKQLQTILSNEPQKRKTSLPLDVEALKDAEVVYVTNRLICMSHPSMASTADGDITANRKLAAVGHLLEKRHDGKFMIWNLSEVEYDYALLNDQVLSFKFPGSPAPPLGLMLKLVLSIESWLKADEGNVAVVHCLTGRGRTATVLAALLCWIGEAGFHDPANALDYIAKCKRLEPDALTIPSQRRYAMYFSNMFEGVRPNQPPLLLKRVILSEAPKFGKNPMLETEDDGDFGCSPYLQIFKAGHLVFTTTATTSLADQSDVTIPFCGANDGPIGFPVDVVVQGDILLRCRHLTKKGQRVSMFRAAFHTGYLPPKVLRLPKPQLDGACSDGRFSEDFFVDLIFEACDASMASKHLLKESQQQQQQQQQSNTNDSSEPQNEAAERRMRGTVTVSATVDKDQNNASSSYTYDSMLHRDSRFWDVISRRRKEHLDKPADDKDSKVTMEGPTIGKRREFSSTIDDAVSNPLPEVNPQSQQKETKAPSRNLHNDPNSFSIGASAENVMGFMDFFLNERGDDTTTTPTKTNTEEKKPKQRDELMEALMAIDDDNVQAETDQKPNETKEDQSVEEIVFVDDDDTQASSITTNTSNPNDNNNNNNNATTTSSAVQKDNHEKNEGVSKQKEELQLDDDMEEEELDLDIEVDDNDEDEELADLEDFLTKGNK